MTPTTTAGDLERLVYVPGHLKCGRCNFRLVSSTLHVQNGVITARDTADICPNDGTPMQRVTWREDVEEAHERWEEQVARAVAAEAALSAAEQREARAVERLQAIIDWADLALSNPGEFDSHGVRNLDGPVFDEARELLHAMAWSPPSDTQRPPGGEGK